MKKNSRELVNVTDCDVQYEEINTVINHAVDLLDDYKVFAYAPKTKKGTARYIVVRRGFKTGEVQVTFVFANNEFRKMNALAKDLMKYCPDVKSVYLNINNEDTHEIFGKEMKHIAGEKFISDELGRFKFNLSPRAFYQLNPEQTIKLYNQVKYAAALKGNEKVVDAYCGVGTIGQWVADKASFYQLNPEQTIKLYNQVKYAAALKGNEKVVDAYCGVGTIGQWVADKASEVRGVDITRQAIADAKENAKLNGLTNTYYAVGKAEQIVPKWANEGFKPDVVIVDPPRTGLGTELIEMLKRVQPKTIVYVSCNPSTLAKNLKELTKKYRVDYIQPVDMFPQTSHVEAVVRLVRIDISEEFKRINEEISCGLYSTSGYVPTNISC